MFYLSGICPAVASKNLMWSANAIHYLMSPQCFKMDQNSFTCKCELYHAAVNSVVTEEGAIRPVKWLKYSMKLCALVFDEL